VKPPFEEPISRQTHPRAQSQSLPARLRVSSRAADELLHPADDFYARIFRDGHTRLFHSLTVHLNFTGENHSHGFLRRCGAASLDEKKIEPFAACLWFHKAFE